MDLTTLLVLAWAGAIALGSRDVLAHDARDLASTALLFVCGLGVAATSVAFATPVVAAGAIFLLASATFAVCWSRLDRVAEQRLLACRSRAGGAGGDPPSAAARLALQDRVDELDSFGGDWLAPVLALVFACVLLASALDSAGWIPAVTAGVVAGVPFIRAARAYVESIERQGLERLLGGDPAPGYDRLPGG